MSAIIRSVLAIIRAIFDPPRLAVCTSHITVQQGYSLSTLLICVAVAAAVTFILTGPAAKQSTAASAFVGAPITSAIHTIKAAVIGIDLARLGLPVKTPPAIKEHQIKQETAAPSRPSTRAKCGLEQEPTWYKLG